MGIEWFRDLSITVLGFVTTIVLIFTAVLAYRLYRMAKSTLALAKATSKVAYDTVTALQESIKSIPPVLALIQGFSEGFKSFSNTFQKETDEGGDGNE